MPSELQIKKQRDKLEIPESFNLPIRKPVCHQPDPAEAITKRYHTADVPSEQDNILIGKIALCYFKEWNYHLTFQRSK